MSDRLIPAEEMQVEMRVSNSRFITSVAPVFGVDEARKFIARVQGTFPDASHHVSAYIIGHGRSVTAHCTDDGEPSGTAGRPALAVLQGSGLGDVAVVVSRYFGGTKLGSGGLVRAYSNSVRNALEGLPLAKKIATHTVAMEIPYRDLERIRYLVGIHQGRILDEDFAEHIRIKAQFMTAAFEAFEQALQQASAGRLQAEILATDSETIFPLGGT